MLSVVMFLLGIILLLKGADYLVDGSSSLAKKFKVPTIVIGLTIVAFGTSMPELIVNVMAAISGNGDIAFGNIVGSNIANLLLILGLAACITNIKVKNSTTWKEVPFSLLAVVVLLIFMSTEKLDNLGGIAILRSNGLILLLFFAIFLYYVFELAHRKQEHIEPEELEIKKLSTSKIIIYIFGGLVALFFGGKWTVDGAVLLARWIGMSEYFISLTIVAVGTSLPELLTTLIAAKKKNMDLAVGNIVGSNIFNIFWILGISAIITPIIIPAFALYDVLVLCVATILLFVFMFINKRHELERWQGIIFILIYIGYIYHLVTRG